MIVLDLGVFLIAVLVDYSPPSIACVMFLLIQGMYILSGVGFYIKSKVEGNRFNTESAKKHLRFVPGQAIFLTTTALAVSFGVQPSIMIFVPAFAIAGLMWLLDRFFTGLVAGRIN